MAPSEVQARADFFLEAMRLSRGQVYLSSFDLSEVEGRLEQPFKPILRLAAPVFDARSQRRGVVLIRYAGEELITRLPWSVPVRSAA